MGYIFKPSLQVKYIIFIITPLTILISCLLFEIKKSVTPDYIQLHGNENPRRCLYIKKKLNIPIIKGIHVENKNNLMKLKGKLFISFTLNQLI